jgi:hypothetical protein
MRWGLRLVIENKPPQLLSIGQGVGVSKRRQLGGRLAPMTCREVCKRLLDLRGLRLPVGLCAKVLLVRVDLD